MANLSLFEVFNVIYLKQGLFITLFQLINYCYSTLNFKNLVEYYWLVLCLFIGDEDCIQIVHLHCGSSMISTSHPAIVKELVDDYTSAHIHLLVIHSIVRPCNKILLAGMPCVGKQKKLSPYF